MLHVTQVTGGLETILLLLFRHYDRSRFEFHLACPPGTTLEAGARNLGIPVHGVPMVRHADPVRDPLALAQLVRLVRRERYAIVHGHSAKGGYLGRLAGRLAGTSKTVYAPQAFSYLSQRRLAKSFFFLLERLAVPLTDLVIAASESERTRAVREVGFRHERVVVIPNSIDFSEAADLPAGRHSASPIILTVGRLTHQKNPEMFVRVAKLVAKRRPDALFQMLGAGFAGPLEAKIRRMVAETGLDGRLEILPWVSKRESLWTTTRQWRGRWLTYCTTRRRLSGWARQDRREQGKCSTFG